jgi:CheY-like chemotaxis protein
VLRVWADIVTAAASNMTEKILFVDDEPAVLEGYKRVLFPEFDIETADGGTSALLALNENGPYALVVSDMRMPVMNGAAFLAKARQSAPDTVRMLLTGYSEMGAAMEAINHGHIFRFLTKPCEPEVLVDAINAGLEQYRLVIAERELLGKTLLGSIKVLGEVLGAASPEAFGRSMRIARYVSHIAAKNPAGPSWCLEAASALSQLGCITLEAELVWRAYSGAKLSSDEQASFETHPHAAAEILKNIPRLEPVAWMIDQQFQRAITPPEPGFAGFLSPELVRSAQILKLAVALELLREKFPAKGAALARVRERRDEFDAALLDAMIDFNPEGGAKQLRKVLTSKLRGGMILDQPIKNAQGVLLVAKGQELTSALIMRIENHAKSGGIDREVMAFVPI